MVNGQPPQQPPGHRLLTALGAGIGLGALALSGYAFTHRLPDGRISDRLGPVTALLGVSLALTALAVAALLAIGVGTVTGRARPGRATALLTAVSALTAYALLNSAPERRLVLISGPGAHPVLGLTRLCWVLLVAAAVLTLAGAVAGDGPAPRRTAGALVRSLPVVALTLAVTVTGGLTAMTRPGQTHPRPADPIPIPATPQTVGEHLAYSIPTRGLGFVVPAGPGFVAESDNALVGYAGDTGAPRWRLPERALPRHCELSGVTSTGTAADAVVIVGCAQHRSAHPRYDEAAIPVHLGLDAMTGRLLWSTDRDWAPAGRTIAAPDAVVVRTGGCAIGVLDPRTGALRWTRPLDTGTDCAQGPDFYATGHTVGYLATHGDIATLHRFDAATGDDRPIDLAPPPGVRLYYRVIATDGDVVLYQRSDADYNHAALVAIDTAAGDVQTLADNGHTSPVLSRRYPGPVVERGTDRSHDTIELYRVAARRPVHATNAHTLTDPGHITGGLQWALVGASMVTATGFTDDRETLLSVAPDGSTTARPSPCGRDVGGVLPAPGAVLLICQRNDNDGGYDVLGLR